MVMMRIYNYNGDSDESDDDGSDDGDDDDERESEDALMNHKGLNREEVRFSLDRDAAAGRYQLC